MFKEFNIDNLKIKTHVFAAPLAGITDLPFRKIIRKCSPSAPIMTEMISCHSLIHNNKKTFKTNCNRNFDNYTDEGLVGAQIFGAQPDIMATAAKILEQNGAAWIDINMGCPVPKVATRAGAGANLMRDHKLAARIVKAVTLAVKIPVSIKTRLGWDSNNLNSAELVKIAADSGARFAIIHGRTRAAGYAGPADWNAIQQIMETTDIPIIFNGDIKTAADLSAVSAMSADGAMIGRGLLGQPWIIGELVENNVLSQADKFDLIMEHFDMTLSYYGARAGVPLFRKHAAWYSTGKDNAAAFRIAVNQAGSPSQMISEMKAFFGDY